MFCISCAQLPKMANQTQSPVNHSVNMDRLEDKVTVVTAFLDLGTFKKGDLHTFSPGLYREWIKVFHRIENPVVAFFDNERDVKMFQVLRNALPGNRTQVVKISRVSMWAFSLRSNIADIFSRPFYPKHHPNTVLPEYSCTMHAKYELMARVVNENPFNTRFFSWLDVGLFRDISANQGPPFSLYIPPNFDRTKVAYSQVYRFEPNVKTAKQIVQGNYAWVCGCFFIATRDIMARWVRQYMFYTDQMLRTGWISTDQQVLYYMALGKHRKSPRNDIIIQPYTGYTEYNHWFQLAYICKEEGGKRKLRLQPCNASLFNCSDTRFKKTL